MKNFKKQFCTTKDGSSTIFLPEFNEYYHSKNGALTESEHVFIKNGLFFWKKNNPYKKNCNIFEVGFGTGLNTYLTFEKSIFLQNINFTYLSIDSHPLELKEISKLNYDKDIKNQESIFNLIHKSEWNLPFKLSNNFKLKKINSEIQDYKIEFSTDIIYFDAFCYRVQPEMWSSKVIRPIINSMNKSSTFVTFSSMNRLYYLLKELKLDVEKIPGPNNKKKMIRAFKNF